MLFPVNTLPKKKHVMWRVMRKQHSLKVRLHNSIVINLNEYLDVLSGENISDKCFVTNTNENVLDSMPNIWSKQEYVKVFDC